MRRILDLFLGMLHRERMSIAEYKEKVGDNIK
jgi:hypothetical protein